MTPAGLDLQPCDIFFARGDRIISFLIRVIERRQSTDQAPAQVNHVGLVVEAPDMIVEALAKVRRVPLRENYGNSDNWIAVYRPLNLTAQQRLAITTRANGYVGDRYGYGKIVLQALGLARFGWIDSMPICSWLVAKAYAEAGLMFGVDGAVATPDHIWRFVNEHPDLYRCVRPLAPLDIDPAEWQGELS